MAMSRCISVVILNQYMMTPRLLKVGGGMWDYGQGVGSWDWEVGHAIGGLWVMQWGITIYMGVGIGRSCNWGLL